MTINCKHFKSQAKQALQNQTLQRALLNLQKGFVAKRAEAIAKFPEFNAVREQAVAVKNATLNHLDGYLTQFENEVIQRGGHVHWAVDAAEACQIVIAICHQQNAKHIIKSKSMLTEEIELNAVLEKENLSVVETDLGEYILQLRNEHPSHIVVPAIHLLKEQISATFYKAHSFDPKRTLDKHKALMDEARQVLRKKFLQADIGITGANFLIAETGSTAIVTNEGNGDLAQILPKTHIVMAGIEKVVPTFEDAAQIIRLLTRSATGQAISTYVTFSTGPKRTNDLDGPENFHVILVDNGRSQLLDSPFQEILRCIRCGACLNHCPVYNAVGGQAYGSVYPGPMGAVLTPSLFGIKQSHELPNASTFCGQCEQVCPMNIPLPGLMRTYREQAFQKHLISRVSHFSLKFWAFLAKRPKWYRVFSRFMNYLLRHFSRKKGFVAHLPFATGWCRYRDFPGPSGPTFQQQLEQRRSHG